MEQHKIHRRLVAAGVTILTDTIVLGHEGDTARLAYLHRSRFAGVRCSRLGHMSRAVRAADGPVAIARLYAESLQAPDLGVGVAPFRREIFGLAGR